MEKRTDYSPERHPWSHADMLPYAVSSAGWGVRYPALHFDGRFEGHAIGSELIEEIFLESRFAVVVRQELRISFIDVSHIPERSLATKVVPHRSDSDWANIKYYVLSRGGPRLIDLKEGLDPRELLLDVYTILATTLGSAPAEPTEVISQEPIQEILVEFPGHHEDRLLRVDTTIGALGGVATQGYYDIIYGRPEV